MLLLWFGVFLISAYICFWWKRKDVWIHGNSFPGERRLPFIGHIHLFSKDYTENFKNVLGFFSNFGAIVTTWIGPELVILVKDPEVVGQVFSHPKVKDHGHYMSRTLSVLGQGLFALEGEEWQRHRKLMAPAFHTLILQEYVKTFAKKARALSKALVEIADGRDLNIYPYLGRCSVDGISESVIGEEVNSLESGDMRVFEYIRSYNELIPKRLSRPWLFFDWIFYSTKWGRKTAKLNQDFRQLSEHVISQKLSSHRLGIRRADVITASSKKLNSFLDTMIGAAESEEGSSLSADELADEVTTLFIAGSETTAITMSLLLILVAIHSDVQDQIHKELWEIFQDDERDVTKEDINKMAVLSRVIKETLRLFPVIPLIPKRIPENIRLADGRTLPKGATVCVVPYAMHRDEANFPDAERFWPDRWLQENVIHPYAFLPFGGGPRGCLGRHYSLLQMKTTLSEVLRKYHVTTRLSEAQLTENLAAGFLLHLRDKFGGYTIQLHKRNT